MKKILFLLLLTVASYGQVSTGQETEFDYGIKNNSTQTVTTPTYLTTTGTDGTQGKIPSAYIAKTAAVQDSLNKKLNLPTGFLQGLQLSINADPTKFDIAPGYYVVTDFTNLANPVVKIITYAGATGLTPAYLASANSTYVALDINGNVVSSASPFTNADRRTLAIVGNVVHSNNTTINVTNEIKAPIVASINQVHDFMRAIGFLNEEGNIYSPNGANLQINKSAGKIFGMGINSADYLNPHQLSIPAQTALTFAYRLRTGTQYANTTSIDPNNWDNAGVLTSVPVGNRWTIQRINLFQSGLARIQYGQTVYTAYNDAVTALPTQPFVTEQNIADNAVFRCYLIVQQGTTNLASAVAAGTALFVPVDKFGNVIGNGSVALTYANIVAALGYTPENVANKSDSYTVSSSTTYASTKALVDGLATKQNNLVSGSNIKTIESQSLVGSGNIDLSKTDIGLSNVDNTTDLNKPISTSTQTALNLKANQSTTYTKTEVDSKIANLNEAYHVDFIDSGTHNFTVPSDIIIQNVYLNNVPVYGSDWSQSSTTVSVTTSLTGDKVTLTGGNFVSTDLTAYARKDDLYTNDNRLLDSYKTLYNTIPNAIDYGFPSNIFNTYSSTGTKTVSTENNPIDSPFDSKLLPKIFKYQWVNDVEEKKFEFSQDLTNGFTFSIWIRQSEFTASGCNSFSVYVGSWVDITIPTIIGNTNSNSTWSILRSQEYGDWVNLVFKINPIAFTGLAIRFNPTISYNDGMFHVCNVFGHVGLVDVDPFTVRSKFVDVSLSGLIADKAELLDLATWGDSITAGTEGDETFSYQYYLEPLIGSKYNIINCGVGGENVPTIAMRQGAMPAYLQNAIVLPADGSPVTIGNDADSGLRSSYDTSIVTPLKQWGWAEDGHSKVNPCYIEGQKCLLKYTAGNYTLQRYDVGSVDFDLYPKSVLMTNACKTVKYADVNIIFVGTNGGYSSPQDLADRVQKMIDFSSPDKFILITQYVDGTGNRAQMDAIDLEFQKRFGSNTIFLRQYFLTHAMYDAGLTNTPSDISRIAAGLTPFSLLADGTHPTQSTYNLIAQQIYQKMIELNLF